MNCRPWRRASGRRRAAAMAALPNTATAAVATVRIRPPRASAIDTSAIAAQPMPYSRARPPISTTSRGSAASAHARARLLPPAGRRGDRDSRAAGRVGWRGPREDAVDDSPGTPTGGHQQGTRAHREARGCGRCSRMSHLATPTSSARGGRLRLCECGEPDRRAGDDEDPFPWRIADAAECNQEHEHADQAESRCRGVWQDEV